MLFFKKRGNESNEPDDIDKFIEENTGPKKETEKSEYSSSSLDKNSYSQSNSNNINPYATSLNSSEIELLKAKMLAQEEFRKGILERINHTTEQIGELRGLLMNQQQLMEKTKAKSELTAQLVQAVRPEGLMEEVKKVDAKTEALRSKSASIEEVNLKIREEMRNVRDSVKLFQNVTEIVRIAHEIKGDIITFKKIEAQVTKESSKVASIYSSLEKSLYDIEKTKSVVDSIAEEQKKLNSEVIKNSQKMTSFATKEEVMGVKAHMTTNLAYLDKEMNKLKELHKKVESATFKMDEREKHLDAMQQKIKIAAETAVSTSPAAVLSEIREIKQKMQDFAEKTTVSDLRYLLMKDMIELKSWMNKEHSSAKVKLRTVAHEKTTVAKLMKKIEKMQAEQNSLKVEIKKIRKESLSKKKK